MAKKHHPMIHIETDDLSLADRINSLLSTPLALQEGDSIRVSYGIKQECQDNILEHSEIMINLLKEDTIIVNNKDLAEMIEMIDYIGELEQAMVKLRVQLAIAMIRTGEIDHDLIDKLSKPGYEPSEDEERFLKAVLDHNQ